MRLIRTGAAALAAAICLLLSSHALANTCVPLQAGATDQTVYVEFIDETTGIPNSSLAFNSSGIDLEYVRSGAAATDITEATQTAGGAHSDGGFVSVGHGRYRLDLPDAAVAAGVPQVVVQGVITGYIMLPCVVALSPPTNVVAFGGTAGTFASGRPEVNTTHAAGTAWGSGAITASSIATDAITAAKIAADAIGASEIATDAIGAAEIAADAIGAAEIANAAIDAATFAAGAIDAAAIATDAIGAAELAANAITSSEIAADAITNAKFDSTAGAFAMLGIVDQGTAQAATSTTIQLRSAAAFADDELIGATVYISSATAGTGQSRTITDYVSSTDTATVANWTTTPSGTITYKVYAAPPGSGGSVSISAGGITASSFAAGAIDATAIANGAIDAATFAAGAIDAAAIATDAIGAAEIAADAIGASEIATDAIGAAELAANAIGAAEIADGAIDEATFATTAGSFDALGIIDQGTAQAATGTTLQLRSAAAFADDEIIGATCIITGGSAGVGQARVVTDYVGSTDTATVETWTTTPSGTITYECFGTAPSTGGGGLDAAGVRAAVGLASANLDTQLSGIQSDTDNIQTRIPAALVSGRIDASVGAYQSGLTPLQPTVSGRTLDVTTTGEAGIDWGNVGAPTTTVNLSGTTISTSQAVASVSGAVGSVTGNVGGTVNGLTATAQGNVRTALGMSTANLDTQLTAIDDFVDDLEARLGTPTDFGSGTSSIAANLQDLADNGTATYDRSTDSLQAIRDRGDAAWTGGGGGAADWTVDERSAMRAILGIPASGTTPDDPTTGILDTIRDRAVAVEADTQDIQSRLPAALVSGRMDSSTGAMAANVMTAAAAASDLTTELQSGLATSSALGALVADIGADGVGLTAIPGVANLEQNAKIDAAWLNCTVNTANFAGSTTTLACIVTDRDDAPVTLASGDLTGLELRVLSGAQLYEGRYINSTTWDAANSELRITLSRALPATLADAVTAVIR